MSWFRGFAIFFVFFLEMFVYSRAFPISFWFSTKLRALEDASGVCRFAKVEKKKLYAPIPLSGIGPDTGVEYSTRSNKIFADTMTPISVVFVCRQQFCEICNCIAVKLATHVLEKSRRRICGEINKKKKIRVILQCVMALTPPPHFSLAVLSFCCSLRATNTQRVDPPLWPTVTPPTPPPERRLVHSDPLAGELLRTAGRHNGAVVSTHKGISSRT